MDILKFRVSEMEFPGVFKRYFPLWTVCCFVRNYTRKTENNAIKISHVFDNITCLGRFTDLKLIKYVFNVIQNWETDALQFYSKVLIFC